MFLSCLFFFHRGQTTRRCHASRLQSSSRYATLCFFTWASGSSTMCFGDPAYPLRVHLQMPFKNMILTPQMVNFNKAISSVRVSVEMAIWRHSWVLQVCRFQREPQDWTFFNRKDVHCLRLIKKSINMLIWQHNLRVFLAGSTHLGSIVCLIPGRIRTCHTLKNIKTFCCVGWWDGGWEYNILSHVWPQGYFNIISYRELCRC